MQEEEKAGGEDGGGAGTYTNRLSSTMYNSNGNSGTSGGTLGTSAYGASSVWTQGIGRNRGSGGSNGPGIGDDVSGVGGALYILPTSDYCVMQINANGCGISASVSGDAIAANGDTIINTNATAGTISGNNSISFIVKKGASVTYTAWCTNYVTRVETITAGTSLNSNNVHVVNVSLNKQTYTHTITCNGSFAVSGRFTDDNGNVTSTSKTGNGSVKFKVWAGDATVTVSKTYYDSKNITISGTGTTPANLSKTKYYLQNVSYDENKRIGGWDESGHIQSLDDRYDRIYLTLNSNWGKISGNRTDVPPNWILYIDRCYIGTSKSNSSITAYVNGSKKIDSSLTTSKSRQYTATGSGSVYSFEVTFRAGVRNVYVDAIYFVVND